MIVEDRGEQRVPKIGATDYGPKFEILSPVENPTARGVLVDPRGIFSPTHRSPEIDRPSKNFGNRTPIQRTSIESAQPAKTMVAQESPETTTANDPQTTAEPMEEPKQEIQGTGKTIPSQTSDASIPLVRESTVVDSMKHIPEFKSPTSPKATKAAITASKDEVPESDGDTTPTQAHPSIENLTTDSTTPTLEQEILGGPDAKPHILNSAQHLTDAELEKSSKDSLTSKEIQPSFDITTSVADINLNNVRSPLPVTNATSNSLPDAAQSTLPKDTTKPIAQKTIDSTPDSGYVSGDNNMRIQSREAFDGAHDGMERTTPKDTAKSLAEENVDQTPDSKDDDLSIRTKAFFDAACDETERVILKYTTEENVDQYAYFQDVNGDDGVEFSFDPPATQAREAEKNVLTEKEVLAAAESTLPKHTTESIAQKHIAQTPEDKDKIMRAKQALEAMCDRMGPGIREHAGTPIEEKFPEVAVKVKVVKMGAAAEAKEEGGKVDGKK
ncbi:hypothetical protein EJ04DRAFT_563245 [Polyplosphaeria fusca]|uniref:Uncharacterized protein n=1 Tax=Polyplosphaeria fusca TaxID=682080 RepID=A0A9P4R315_9PLEO|nr:hypothetical protein EJ04DRAFT_563245 [Polyplosphaeria fusca]